MQDDIATFSVFAASDAGTFDQNDRIKKTLQKNLVVDPTEQDLNFKPNIVNKGGLVLAISGHGDPDGNIALVKNTTGAGYIAKPTLNIIKQILLQYKDVKDIENIPKTIIISQYFSGSIRKQLEKEIGSFTDDEKKVFSKLKIFTYASSKYLQYNFWIRKKLLPILERSISAQSFNQYDFIQDQVASGLSFNMMLIQNEKVVGFDYNLETKNSIKAKVTFNELLSVMKAYDQYGVDEASKIIKEKNDKIIDELCKKEQLNPIIDPRVLKAQFKSPKTNDEIEEWIRDSYAWIAMQQFEETGHQSKDAKLLLIDPIIRQLYCKHILKTDNIDNEKVQSILTNLNALLIDVTIPGVLKQFIDFGLSEEKIKALCVSDGKSDAMRLVKASPECYKALIEAAKNGLSEEQIKALCISDGKSCVALLAMSNAECYKELIKAVKNGLPEEKIKVLCVYSDNPILKDPYLFKLLCKIAPFIQSEEEIKSLIQKKYNIEKMICNCLARKIGMAIGVELFGVAVNTRQREAGYIIEQLSDIVYDIYSKNPEVLNIRSLEEAFDKDAVSIIGKRVEKKFFGKAPPNLSLVQTYYDNSNYTTIGLITGGIKINKDGLKKIAEDVKGKLQVLLFPNLKPKLEPVRN